MSYLLTFSIISIVIAYLFAVTDMLKFSMSTSLELKYSVRTIISVFVAIILTVIYVVVNLVK